MEQTLEFIFLGKGAELAGWHCHSQAMESRLKARDLWSRVHIKLFLSAPFFDFANRGNGLVLAVTKLPREKFLSLIRGSFRGSRLCECC